MPPPLWIAIEVLFGFWVYLNRRNIRRVIEFLLAPPPLAEVRLPDFDQMPIATGVTLGAVLGWIISSAALTIYGNSGGGL